MAMARSEALSHTPARVRSSEVAAWLERTHSPIPETRRVATRVLCPCHVRADRDGVWDQLIEMTTDEDRKVRS